MQIDRGNIGITLDLLVRGFPDFPLVAWEKGLDQWMASPAHESGDEPIGYLLSSGNRYVGVGLTAVSWCDLKRERHINLAAWYIDPEHRLRFPILLRDMMRDPAATYTDLTPSDDVVPILKRLGFRPLNAGVQVLNLVAAAVLPSSGAKVSVLSADASLEQSRARMVRDHISYGCIALEIANEAGASADSTIILLKPVRPKGVPLLSLIYYEDKAVILRHLSDIARVLIRLGHFGALLEIAPDEKPRVGLASYPFMGRRRRYIKNGAAQNGADYRYTELAYLPLS